MTRNCSQRARNVTRSQRIASVRDNEKQTHQFRSERKTAETDRAGVVVFRRRFRRQHTCVAPQPPPPLPPCHRTPHAASYFRSEATSGAEIRPSAGAAHDPGERTRRNNILTTATTAWRRAVMAQRVAHDIDGRSGRSEALGRVHSMLIMF